MTATTDPTIVITRDDLARIERQLLTAANAVSGVIWWASDRLDGPELADLAKAQDTIRAVLEEIDPR